MSALYALADASIPTSAWYVWALAILVIAAAAMWYDIYFKKGK